MYVAIEARRVDNLDAGQERLLAPVIWKSQGSCLFLSEVVSTQNGGLFGGTMKLTKVLIENFRAHTRTELPLSNFGCLIGENNAGKSSVLHALHFAIKGAPPNKLVEADFNDVKKPIRVELVLDEIDDHDLARISDTAHRHSIENVLTNGQLILVRTATHGAKITTTLQRMKLQPTDNRWSLEDLNNAITGKKNPQLRESAVAQLPELDEVLEDKPTLTAIRAKREELIEALPAKEMKLQETALPTGISTGLTPLLPEVIYIEAVKDASAEVKTTDAATFGKLLKILLDEVADQFGEIEKEFQKIQRKLSRHTAPDGSSQDTRLEQVKFIESTIEGFVQESFPGVALRMDVPAPELRTILSSAELQIHDGHEGPISSKGDGLKRTVAFAILRAYTALREGGFEAGSPETKTRPSYLLLFEEPELYLHPRAQRQLFDALANFSIDHPVMVTTHSPTFFDADSTATFAKLRKLEAPETGVHAVSIDLKGQISNRDAFQLICHENNEAALFARVVVLVEGDSDVLVFPHLAKLLNSDWDHVEQNIVFIRTGGKGSISRYRKFFAHFGIDVHAIADLDALVDGFHHLSVTTEAKNLQEALSNHVATLLPAVAIPPNSDKVKSIAGNRNARELWGEAQAEFAAWTPDVSLEETGKLQDLLTQIFDLARTPEKISILQADDSTTAGHLDAVLRQLSTERVHVLRRGDLETYYGGVTAKSEKIDAATKLRAATPTLELFLERHGKNRELVRIELETLLKPIFVRR